MLRHRFTFKADEDVYLSDGPILDEQEQEELVRELRLKNERNDVQNLRVAQGILFIDIMLQLIFLLGRKGDSPWTPLAMIFSISSSPSQPLIPLSILWTVLGVAQHIHAMLLLNPTPLSLSLPLSIRSRIDRRSWPILLIAPLLSTVVLRKDILQSIWWALPALVHAVTAWIRSEIERGRADVDRLDGLRYHVKGA